MTVLGLAVRGLWARKRRLIGSGTAVVLGVAFLFATLAVSDTVRSGFERLFGDAYAGVDVVVRDANVVGSDDTRRRGTVGPDVVDDVTALPEVAAAEPYFEGVA